MTEEELDEIEESTDEEDEHYEWWLRYGQQ